MTEQELRNTGKDGIYDAQRDEWFITGEEPPAKPPEPIKAERAELPAKPAEIKGPVAEATDVKTKIAGKKP